MDSTTKYKVSGACFGRQNSYFSYSFLLTLFIWLVGCNITYKVRNQDNAIEHIVFIPCGKITIELVGKGNSKFVLKQDFDLDANVAVFTDSLCIAYNGKKVLPVFNIKMNEVVMVEANKEFDLQASFDLDEGVFDGDTILVFGRSYIECNQHLISLDTLLYSFVNNFRIQGVNYPKEDFHE